MSSAVGKEAAHDITESFRLHFPHEYNVMCTFVGDTLTLIGENDYDPEGLNLMDEFSDHLCAFLPPFDGEMRLVRVEPIA